MKKMFFTGLITLLPFTLTFIVVIFIFNLLTIPFEGLIQGILAHTTFFDEPFLFLSKDFVLQTSSKLLAASLLVILILAMGFFGGQAILKAIFSFGNALIEHIPLVNKIYKGVQDAVNSFLGSEESSFSDAVLVPYPHNDAYALGLIAKNQNTANDEIMVFIPSALNPTYGFMLSFKLKDILYLETSVEEAIKFAVSCGIMFKNFKIIK